MVAGFLYLIYRQQDKILYLPEAVPPRRTSENPAPFANPAQMHMKYRDVHLTSKDGTKLHAWWIPQDNSKRAPTLIFFHANAGNMGHRIPNIKQLVTKLGFNVFILSYRGYGESDGEPEEYGIKEDAQATWDYVTTELAEEIDPKQLYVFGRSLGGAVAIHLADKVSPQITGLILENTFTCISDMVGKVFPWLDFAIVKAYMLKLKWGSKELIGNLECPILFLAGDQDEIVPHEQMVQLREGAKRAKFTELLVVEGGTHNDVWQKGGERYWAAWRGFVERANKAHL
jgi:pimeloyl-ACP methyl ester carboxylesterase